MLTAGDEARRRVVRDLHDGAQQRLVHAILTLKHAQQALQENDGDAQSLIREALEQVERGNAELRELAQGILPGALAHGGLRAALRSVVARLDLPVQVDLRRDRRCRSHQSRARGDGRQSDRARGRLEIESPAGNGTLVAATVPLSAG